VSAPARKSRADVSARVGASAPEGVLGVSHSTVQADVAENLPKSGRKSATGSAAVMPAEAVAAFIMELRHDVDVLMARFDARDGPQPAPKGSLPLKRAAAVLGYSVETLRRRAVARAIPSVRVGGRWHISVGNVESLHTTGGDMRKK
jgi:hypothetical protein